MSTKSYFNDYLIYIFMRRYLMTKIVLLKFIMLKRVTRPLPAPLLRGLGRDGCLWPAGRPEAGPQCPREEFGRRTGNPPPSPFKFLFSIFLKITRWPRKNIFFSNSPPNGKECLNFFKKIKFHPYIS